MDGSSRVDEFADEAIDISEIATTELHSIGDLLDALHLSKWTRTFSEEMIDLPTLFFLQDEHLIRLNVPMSERIKLLRCIQLMKDVPPPSAEMMAKWSSAAPRPAVMPVRPPPRVTFEEKVHEDDGEQEEEKYGDYQAEEEQQQVQEEAEEEPQQEYEYADNSAVQEEEYAPEGGADGAIAAGAMAAGAIAGALAEEKESKGGESFAEGYKAHSMVFLRSEATGKSEQIYGKLQEAFEDDLRAGMVAFVPSDDAEQVLQCLEVFLQDSKPTDDLLWVVIAGSGTTDSISDGLSFGSVLDKVERGYRGSRAIFVIDSNSNVEIPEEDEETLATKQQANPDLQFAVLYAMSSSPQNEFAMSLNLLDTIRGLIPVMPPDAQQQTYTISELVGDALEMQRFFKDASGEEVLIEFIATPEFVENDLPIILPEKMPIPKTAITDHCGKRALYDGNRPVQILEMNGPERAYVRFMVEVCDPEWVDLGDLILLESTEQVTEAEEEEEEEQQDSGTGRPLPMPTMTSSEDLLAEEQPVVEEEQQIQEEDVVIEEEAVATEETMYAEEEHVISEIEETTAVEEEAVAYEEPVASEEVLDDVEEQQVMETEDTYVAEESAEVEMEAVDEEVQMVEEQAEEPVEQVYEQVEVEQTIANAEILEEQPVEMEQEELIAAEEDQQEPVVELAAEEEMIAQEEAMEEQAQEEVMMEEETQMIDQEVVDESEYQVVDDQQIQDEFQADEDAVETMQEEVLDVEEEDVMTTNDVPFLSTTPKLSLAEIESIHEMELMDDIPADDAPDMGHTDEPPVTMMHEEIILDEFDDEMEPVEEIEEAVIE